MALQGPLVRRISAAVVPALLIGAAVMTGAAGCASRTEAGAKASAGGPAAVNIIVRISDQKLFLIENGKVVRQYPVSTSKFGIGSQAGSFKTPLGRHRVAEKIGRGAPLYTIFKERVNTRKLAVIDRTLKGAPYDDVTTRILWLEGLEPGVNRGAGIDSKERFIYIHGTPSEGLIGRPASNGCVRMYNEDVIELFDRVPEGTPVLIQK